MENMKMLIEQLTAKKLTEGCSAMKTLLAESEQTNMVYPYLSRLIDLLGNDNSYIRTRALLLISANAKWDVDYLIDENIEDVLAHITDPKPITARQFIQTLPTLMAAKPDLRDNILAALRQADTLSYPLSMRPLVEEDIRKALLAITAQENQSKEITGQNE